MPVRGIDAASLATSWFGPVQRKYGECGRSTRTRRSAGFRPWIARLPPINVFASRHAGMPAESRSWVAARCLDRGPEGQASGGVSVAFDAERNAGLLRSCERDRCDLIWCSEPRQADPSRRATHDHLDRDVDLTKVGLDQILGGRQADDAR